ncbi:hypothetical protein HPB52_009034 [Rhipicephalus sanguineus]|uniref:Uncharacterized protein n=1 Tax=Rhipicephalus sanguineus TaxID=34632 RepID=A0A9D4Q979_RHISA|nr:hypothetical protein HPB52_009034 [Rhipicephalus sanguineus]
MTSLKKGSSDVRKYRTRHKYRGKRRKALRTTTAANDARDAPVRPTADIGHHDIGNHGSSEIDAAVVFVSASQKKMEFFKSGASTVLCEIGALTALVAGSARPTCRERKIAVREVAEIRKGLSSFLELRCDKAECLESVLSFTHKSKRINSAGECGDPGNIRYDSGSSRDGFAVNVKAVLAARAIAKTWKRHGGSRRITQDTVGGGDVPVMFDGTWRKRGHKSHNGVATAVSLDTGLCLDFEFSAKADEDLEDWVRLYERYSTAVGWSYTKKGEQSDFRLQRRRPPMV